MIRKAETETESPHLGKVGGYTHEQKPLEYAYFSFICYWWGRATLTGG